MKKKIKTTQLDVAKMLVANRWRPNSEYIGHVFELDENGLHEYFGCVTGYLIDSDGIYAATLKSRVITIHDSKRSYCKIISMQYCNIKLMKDRIICGKIIFVA